MYSLFSGEHAHPRPQPDTPGHSRTPQAAAGHPRPQQDIPAEGIPVSQLLGKFYTVTLRKNLLPPIPVPVAHWGLPAEGSVGQECATPARQKRLPNHQKDDAHGESTQHQHLLGITNFMSPALTALTHEHPRNSRGHINFVVVLLVWLFSWAFGGHEGLS